jgi:AcrR family transcriptional regulator
VQSTPAAEFAEDRPRRKGEITRERILDAAEALFAERGFDGMTLRDVAASVGLRNPSLYNHFGSRESLYAAVLERDIGPLLGLLVEQGREAAAAEEEIIAAAMRVLARQRRFVTELSQRIFPPPQRSR